MRTRIKFRQNRFSGPLNVSDKKLLDRVWDDELEAPFGGSTAMGHERDFPTLQKHLREFGLLTIQ
jgi:hypothetical protein